MTDATPARTAHDTMGDMEIPAGALWGASTQRAKENFPVSGVPVPFAVIQGQAMIKWAAAKANVDLDVVSADVADVIRTAADEVIEGGHRDQFPVDTFQTGSGTSTNMNVNEVLANRAKQIMGADLDSDVVHPNDHVNASQSSNDSFPSAVHIACARTAIDTTIPGLQHLHDCLAAKAAEWSGVVKSGRTHLMDATPVTLGQEFGGYARQVELGIGRIHKALDAIHELALGGTAVGTGLNCPPGFVDAVISQIADRTGIPFREAADHFEAQGSRDALVELSGALKVVATSLIKIANDVRWLSSGPRTGLGELNLPAIQPGSSIMPGKVNPVIPESVRQVGAQVIGNDAAVTVGGLSGELELNVMIPLMARNVIESLELIGNVSRLFVDRCLANTEATDAGPRHVEQSLMSVTALVPEIGYERSAKLAKTAHKEGKTLREVAVADGVDEAVLDRVLNYMAMAEGGIL